MTFGEYSRLAMRTFTYWEDPMNHLVGAVMGLCGESGEFTDELKKARFHRHPLREEDLAAELGDILWYIALVCELLKLPMDGVASRNMLKLKRRYGVKFTSEQSLFRVKQPLPPLEEVPVGIEDYHSQSMAIALCKDDKIERLLEGALGLCGESGEVADILKKHRYQGHALAVDDIATELGDVLWYAMWCADALGLRLEHVARVNIDKLRKRYPDGFTAEKSREAHGIAVSHEK